MRVKRKRFYRKGCARPLLLLLLIGGALFWFFSSRSSEANTIVHSAEEAGSGFNITGSNLGQIFENDLEVTSRTPIDGDATVYSGDVTVKEGGVIHGNLIVFSGDIEVEHGGLVHGDVTAFSGEIDLEGTVQGNLSAASGDIYLADTAQVQGDVSVISGSIEREEGSVVHGNVLSGPNIPFILPKLPALPGAVETAIDGSQDAPSPPNEVPALPDAPAAASNWASWLGGIILGIVGTAAAVALVTGSVVGVTSWRPSYVARVEETMRSQLPLSFAFGFLANLPLIGLISLLRLVFCLAPLATLLLLGFLVINVPGWAAVSHTVGRRLTRSAGLTSQPLAATALGALVLSLPIALFWMAGGFLSFVGFVLLLLISSAGGGAVLLPWVRKFSSSGRELTTKYTHEQEPSHTIYSTAEVVPESAPVTAEGAPATKSVDQIFAELDAMRESTSDVGAAGADAPRHPTDEAVDDFTRIDGIGRIFDRRLKDVGIKTYAQLAALSPEQVSAIIGWSPARVERDDLLGQARRLAAQ